MSKYYDIHIRDLTVADSKLLADMGVLHDLSEPDMLQILSRSGLTQLTKKHLAKTMEAAVLKSPRRYCRSLIITGIEIFERETDGSLAGHAEPLFWTEIPEFGHLERYRTVEKTSKGENHDQQIPIKERLAEFCNDGKRKDM